MFFKKLTEPRLSPCAHFGAKNQRISFRCGFYPFTWAKPFIVLAFALLLVVISPLTGQAFGIDALVIQKFGYVGDLAVGPSWNLGNEQSFTFLYGTTRLEKVEKEIRQYTLKYQKHWRPYYAGLFLTYSDSEELFVDEPNDELERYYGPTAYYVAFSLGRDFSIGATDFYFEFSSLYNEFYTYTQNHEFFMENYKYFGLEGVVALGMGMRINF